MLILALAWAGYLTFTAKVGRGSEGLSGKAPHQITHHNPVPQPAVPRPRAGLAFRDPIFETALIRITDSKGSGASGIVPQYSKRQAWNCNESLLLLQSCDGNSLLYDGVTYKFKKILEGVGGDDLFWHPTLPTLLYYAIENILYSFNVETGERKKLHTFTGYAFADTHGEGNLSRDGRYYALAGRTYNASTGEVKYKDLLVYDLVANKVTDHLALPAGTEAFDWISISPGGRYVVVDYADDLAGRFHGLEVYDRQFHFLWQKPLGAGHSDLGLDENNDEVLVMDFYDPQSNSTFIKKFRLADGKETILLELSPLFDLHISCRDEKHQAWCLISTFDFTGRLTDSDSSWLPFEDEIFALKLDGSGEVRRLAHHHSRRYSPSTPDSDRSVYFAEPHATVSRNGDRILFGSNWRMNIGSEKSLDTYLIDLRDLR